VNYKLLKLFATGEPQLVTLVGTQAASVQQYGAGTLSSIDYCVFHTQGKRVISYDEIVLNKKDN
jgi:hypothetical protein